MHTFIGKTCRIHHHSDYSGELHIFDEKTLSEIRIDAEDILKFVAEYIRSNKIGQLENMDVSELLK